MPELCRDLHLVHQFLERDIAIGARDLECDVHLLDRVIGTIDVGERPRGDSAKDAVFVELLSCAEHVSARS